jgi:hypothetical protein
MNRNITALILIVLAAGLYFTYTSDVLTEAKTIQVSNNQYVSALNNATKLIQKRDSVLKSFNSISQGDRDKLNKMLPSTVDNIRLVIELNSIALQHGFSLKNVKATVSSNNQSNLAASAPSGKSAAGISIPTLDTVTVSFSVSDTASYQGFVSFLQDLESDQRLMDVTHLTVTANDTGNYDYSVELKTYWLRQ